MFEKVNRSGLIIYLYYNRDAKKLQDYGDIPRVGNTLCGQSLSIGKRYHRKSSRKTLTIF